ncbi:hypothetical protein GCK72_014741 [Caenorhabditis remanei]|uniref:PDZ domain-containing protein n=1 Tax=Caenorhabditis remanei TaxID=31234 RepID=A0A6A5GUY4_CAERE|nr:hypothetical protein GCK72_014741 [Caenorhabditis remanei]KAF1758283.1 hypothetical protein GCK72_014741 [Caenorhabditis remanei]
MNSTVSMHSVRSSISESRVNLETTMNTAEGHISNVPADVTEIIPRITTVTVKVVPGKTCGVVLNDSLDIVRLENGSFCESAIQVGDRVLSVNRSQCNNPNEFYSLLYASGDTVEICVKREEKTESELADLLKDDGDMLGSLKTREGFTYTVTRTRTDKNDKVFGLTVIQYSNRVLVSDLMDDSRCAELLEKGDHICDIDRIPVTNHIEFQRIIEDKLMTQQIVSLLIERPESDEARKWISDGLNQEKSNFLAIDEVSVGKNNWVDEDGQIKTKKPMLELWNPKISNLVDENSSEETIFSEVVSTMFPTVYTEDLAREEAIINQTRRSQRKPWKSTKQISQSILKAPGVVEDELVQLSMNDNYDFTFVNVNRKAADDAENALNILLESIGIEGKHELSSYARLPIKGYCHFINFSVWSPIDAKKLYRLVGSEKLWHKLFVEGVVNGAAAFVWTRVTTEQVLNAALATTIKSFNIEYELSEKITQIDGKQLKRDLANSRSYRNIMIALKKCEI